MGLHALGLVWQLLAVTALAGAFMIQDAKRWKVTETVLAGMLLAVLAMSLWQPLEGAAHHHVYLPLLGAGLFLFAGLVVRSLGAHFAGTEAFGPADLVLAAFAGAFLGWQAVLAWFLAGSLLGAGYFFYVSRRRRRRAKRRWSRLPAGPGFCSALIILEVMELAGLYHGFPFA